MNYVNDQSMLDTTSRHRSMESLVKILGQRVTRGRDWQWGDQDGGDGSLGTVIKVFLEDPPDGIPQYVVGDAAPSFGIGGARSYGGASNTVLVRWDNSPAQLYNYRTGYQGKYDLRVTDCSPIVEKPMVLSAPVQQANCDLVQEVDLSMFIRASDFRPGEAVQVLEDARSFVNSGTYADWNPEAKKMVGKLGVVRRATDSGLVRVAFNFDLEYAFPPRVLMKAFQKGDVVRITSNRSIVPSEDAVYQRINNRKVIVVDVRSTGQCKIAFLTSDIPETMWLHSNCLSLSRGGTEERKKRTKRCVDSDTGIVHDLVEASSSSSDRSTASSGDYQDRVEMFPSDKESVCSDEGEPDAKMLFAQATGGNVTRVADIVRRCPQLVNAKVEHGQTALHIAAMRGHGPVVDCLLENGAQISITDNDGDNALHFAVHKDHTDLFGRLIRADPSCLNAQNGLLLTPFHLAVRKRHRASVEALLRYADVDVNTRDLDNDTPLHDAVKLSNESIIDMLFNDARIIQSFTAQNRSGLIPFHLAACLGDSSIIRKFLGMFPECSQERMSDGSTALHVVVLKNNLSGLTALLEFGVYDVNVKTRRGLTPLHVAVAKSHSASVEKLMEYSPDLSVQDEEQRMTALHYAADRLMRKWASCKEAGAPSATPCTFGQILQLQSIEDADAPMKHYVDACQCDELAIVCYLLTKGADPSVADGKGRTLFDIVTEKILKPVLERFILLGRFGSSLFNLAAAAAPEPIQEAEAAGDDAKKCSGCGENDANVVHQPCGHRFLCLTCFFTHPNFKQCPRCQGEITASVGPDGADLTEEDGGEGNRVVAHLKDENERLKDKSICRLCFDRERNLMAPCGHSVCRECAFDMNPFGVRNMPRFLDCPFCRRPINGRWVEMK